MNQFFSLKRFSLLVVKHWADNRRRYHLSTVAIFGLLNAWFVFLMLSDSSPAMGQEVQQITFYLGLFATGTFYSSQYFRDLGSRERGSNFLLVPASTFEKLLCSILYSVVFFFLVYLGVYYLADGLLVALINASHDSKIATVTNVFSVTIFPENSDFTISLVLFYFAVQAAFLLGSVFYSKYSFVKTIITGFLAWFVIFCLLFFLYEHLLPPGEYFEGSVTSYRIYVDGVNDHMVTIPRWMIDVIGFIGRYAIPPFLWVATYFRLKEKQV